MKNVFRSPVMIALFVIVTLASCSSPAEKVDTAKENLATAEKDLEKAKLDSIAKHERLKAEYMVLINESEKQLADYKVKIASQRKEDRLKDEERLAKLIQKNSDMKDSLNKYETSALDRWETFKLQFKMQQEEFNADMSELGKSLANFGKKD